MTKDTSVLVLGLIVAITPFLGIPGEWKTIIFVSAGILISFLTFLIKRDREMHENLNGGLRASRGRSDKVIPGATTHHEGSTTEEK